MLASIASIKAAVADKLAYSKIGQLYGVSAATVARFAKEHGFYEERSMDRARKLSQTPEFVREVQQELYEGAKITALAARYRVSRDTLKRFCDQHGLYQLTPEEVKNIRKERRRDQNAAKSKKSRIARWDARYEAEQAKRMKKMQDAIRQREV